MHVVNCGSNVTICSIPRPPRSETMKSFHLMEDKLDIKEDVRRGILKTLQANQIAHLEYTNNAHSTLFPSRCLCNSVVEETEIGKGHCHTILVACSDHVSILKGIVG